MKEGLEQPDSKYPNKNSHARERGKRRGALPMNLERITLHPTILHAIADGQKALVGADVNLLVAQAQSGNAAAREKLILAHLWLCKFIAAKMYGASLNVEERFGLAVEGLCLAIEKFNPARGKFASFAGTWIRKQILKVDAQTGRLIQVQELTLCWMRRLGKSQETDLSQNYQLAALEMGFSADQVARVLAGMAAISVCSLFQQRDYQGSNNDQTLEECIVSDCLSPSQELEAAEEAGEHEKRKALMFEAIGNLEPFNRQAFATLFAKKRVGKKKGAIAFAALQQEVQKIANQNEKRDCFNHFCDCGEDIIQQALRDSQLFNTSV